MGANRPNQLLIDLLSYTNTQGVQIVDNVQKQSNTAKTTSLPFTTIQTLELLKIEKFISPFVSSRFGKRKLHNLILNPYVDVQQIKYMNSLVRDAQKQ